MFVKSNAEFMTILLDRADLSGGLTGKESTINNQSCSLFPPSRNVASLSSDGTGMKSDSEPKELDLELNMH